MYSAGPSSPVWLANFVNMFMSKMPVSLFLKNSFTLNEAYYVDWQA
jgi:hypothetical protein